MLFITLDKLYLVEIGKKQIAVYILQEPNTWHIQSWERLLTWQMSSRQSLTGYKQTLSKKKVRVKEAGCSHSHASKLIKGKFSGRKICSKLRCRVNSKRWGKRENPPERKDNDLLLNDSKTKIKIKLSFELNFWNKLLLNHTHCVKINLYCWNVINTHIYTYLYPREHKIKER